MREFEYVCVMCNTKSVEASYDLNDTPCTNASCDGIRRRVWSFYLAQVPGAGGSPGKRAGG